MFSTFFNVFKLSRCEWTAYIAATAIVIQIIMLQILWDVVQDNNAEDDPIEWDGVPGVDHEHEGDEKQMKTKN